MKNSTTKLTSEVAKNAVPAAAGDYIIRDSKTQGFGLRVYRESKVWIAQRKIGGRPVKVVLGRYPDMLAEDAREAAKIALGEMASGVDPIARKRKEIAVAEAERARTRLTIAVVWNEYVGADAEPSADTPVTNDATEPPVDGDAANEKGREGKGAGKETATEKDRRLAHARLKDGALWKRPLAEVTGFDLDDEFKRLCRKASKDKAARGGETQAGATLRYLRAAVNRAILRHFDGMLANPFVKFNSIRKGWYRVQPRKRTVGETEQDLAKWWKAVDGLRNNPDGRAKASEAIADFLVLTLLWGARGRSEVLSLRWDDVDFERRMVTFTKTKNGEAHQFPLAPYAEKILLGRKESVGESEFVFPAVKKSATGHLTEPKKAIDAVVKASGVKFSPHDLRRTFATAFRRVGGAEIVSLALNHSPVTTADKHYSVGGQKIRVLRPYYEKVEALLLEEAGAACAVGAQPDKQSEVSEAV